jgi:hypothetical protein
MIINKKKGLLNEFQVQIVYLKELLERLEIYNQVNSKQAEVLLELTESYQRSINDYINQVIKKEND